MIVGGHEFYWEALFGASLQLASLERMTTVLKMKPIGTDTPVWLRTHTATQVTIPYVIITWVE